MALYNEMSMDDYNKLVARNQQRQSQAAAQNLANRQAALQAAQGKKQGSLVDTLVGLATGLKERGSDILNTAKNVGKTAVGLAEKWTGQDGNKEIKAIQNDDSARRNEIAKKYGFNSYSEAINSGKVGDDFWNEIKSNNEKTKELQKKNDKWIDNRVGNVTKINTNEAKGQALNTIDSVFGLLPGGAGAAANVVGGGLSGIGDEYKAAAAEGRDFNANNAKVNAIAGMAGGAAGSGAGGLLGKAANKAGGNALGKILGSQLGQGIGSGAAAGAAGAAAGTLAQGGTLQDALTNAWEGAKGGAVAGGAMAGTMGLAGNALNRIRGGRAANIADNAPIRNAEPAEAQIVQKNRVEAPTAQRIAETVETPSNRRGIAITDLDAGAQEVNVRNGRPTESRGKYIDSVVRRSDANLPEAQRPVYTRVAEPIIDTDGNFFVNDGIERIKTINGKTTTYTGDGDWNGAKVYSQDGRGLPDGYKLMFDENAAPANNYVAIENPNGNKALIELPQASEYDYERVGMATGRDREGLMDSGLIAPEGGFRGAGTPRKISIEKALGQTQDVPVENLTTNYQRSTIPAKQYEQTVAKMPEAETTTPKTVVENATVQTEPELDYNTQLSRQKAQIAADKAKLQATRGVLEQYGTTRLSDRIEGLPNAIQDMLDLGLADRAEIDLFSKKLASGDSELAKAIRKSLNDAGNIDANTGFTWEQVFAASGAQEPAQKKIKSFYDAQSKKYQVNADGTMARSDMYDLGKSLEKEGYKRYDRGVRNQNNTDYEMGEALINMSQDIIGKATDGVDVSGKFDANKLKNLLPGNEVWANKVDTLNANAKTVQDLRSAMASATKMNLLKQAEEYNLNTYGQNVGGKGKGGAAVKAAKSFLTGKPLAAAEAGAEMVLGSNTVKQKAIKKSYDNYKKYQAQANGEVPTTPTGKVAQAKQFIADKAGRVGETAKNIAGKAGEKIGNATSKLNDTTAANIAIGGSTLGNIAQNMANRTIAKNQAEFANNRANAAQAQTAYDQAATDYTTALANQQAAEQNVLQGQTGNTATLNRIAQAMDLAMAAGDINAYSQLADLYKQAYNIYEMQNPTAKTESKALSANQSKALAASQQLEQLAQMTPNAGTVASNIPLLGNLVDLTGGNEYANQAEALATTLGYLLSGANIKESEAKRIGQSYVPNAFDSENVRQQKLDRARQLIQSYMSDTGALAA